MKSFAGIALMTWGSPMRRCLRKLHPNSEKSAAACACLKRRCFTGPCSRIRRIRGVSVLRDQSFGPDPKNVLDVFSPEKGGGSRPVLIYVSGGPGNKIQPEANGDAFYDNIMLWAVKNGMTGVNMQRRQGTAWDDPAKDVALVVEWVHTNITKYKGNPNRVFIWSQSAGNLPVSTYIGHPEFYGPNGVGLKGAILMSAPNFNILPVTPPPPAGGRGGFAACGGGGAPAGAQAARGGAPGGHAAAMVKAGVEARLPWTRLHSSHVQICRGF